MESLSKAFQPVGKINQWLNKRKRKYHFFLLHYRCQLNPQCILLSVETSTHTLSGDVTEFSIMKNLASVLTMMLIHWALT